MGGAADTRRVALSGMFARLILALCLAPLLVIAAAGLAFAHAGLISADPPAGSVVSEEPASITLTFTEPVVPTGISLIGVGTPSAALGFTQPDGPIVEIPLPSGLPDGSYLLSWRVTSADGHPVNGTIDFAIGAPSGTLEAPATSPLLGVAIWFVRAAQYVALFLGVGTLAVGALARLPAGALWIGRLLASTGLLLVPAALALHGLDLTGATLPALLTGVPWVAAGTSVYAATEAVLALAFVLCLLPGRWSGLAALAAVAAPTLSGHVVTAPPEGLMRAILAIHIASLVVWLGSLVPLMVFLARGDLLLLRRVSAYAPFAVAGLLGTGLGMALVQLGAPGPDWMSPYALLLWTKLALVSLLLGLALLNRLRLTSLALRGETVPLRRSIAGELVLAVLILGVVAGWRFTPPPRVIAEIEAANAPATAELSGGGRTASLVASPGRAGPMTLSVRVEQPARGVTLLLSNPGQGIATITRPATLSADGLWRITGLVLPAGGDWQVQAEIRIDDFDQAIAGGTLVLPPTAKDDPMKLPSLAVVAVSSALAAAPVIAGPGLSPGCPTGQTFTIGAITVTGAFVRATPKGAQSAGAYLTIANGGTAPDTFLGATSDAASDVTLHSMSMDGNIMKMAPVEGGLAVPAGGSVALSPMGYHLMLTGMEQQFVEGQCVEMTLHFATAGDLRVELNIGGFAQDVPPTGDSTGGSSTPMDHDMSDMSSMTM